MPMCFPCVLEAEAGAIQVPSEIPLCHSQISHMESSQPLCLSLLKVRQSCHGAILLCWGCSTYLCTLVSGHNRCDIPFLSTITSCLKSWLKNLYAYTAHLIGHVRAGNCLCKFFCPWNWCDAQFYFFSRVSLLHLLQVKVAIIKTSRLTFRRWHHCL